MSKRRNFKRNSERNTESNFYIMTKKAVIVLVIIFGFSVNIFAQKTIQQKEYYDYLETRIKRISNVMGNGNMHGDDKSYYYSGKIETLQKWNYGSLVSSTGYFETGEIKWIKNYKDGKPEGEQKIYEYYSKYQQKLYVNILNEEVIEFKIFDGNGKIIGEYKKNVHLKQDDNFHNLYDNFTIKNGNLYSGTGKGIVDYKATPYLIEVKDGKLLSINDYITATSTSTPYTNTPYFEIVFGNNKIKRTAILEDVEAAYHNKISNKMERSFYYYKYTQKFLPFSAIDNIQIPITAKYDSGWENVYIYKLHVEDIVSKQFENTVIDSLLTISDINGNVKEKRFYENGLLIWSEKDGNRTQREYKKDFSLEDENAIKPFLKFDKDLGTNIIDVSEKDYTYKTFDKQNNVIASSEMDEAKEKEKAKQAEEVAKQAAEAARQAQIEKECAKNIEFLKKEFYSYKIASNIKGIYSKHEDSIYKDAKYSYPINPTEKQKSELGLLYQSAINVIKKIGINEFNKGCKGIKTETDLLKYLNSIK